MCQDPDIDAVFVGTPNQWHVPIGLEVVKNGKHVMITKPLADSEMAGEDMVAAADDAGVVNMMSLSTRFGDECRHLGHLARDGYFGELYYARSRSVRRNGIPAWNLGFIKKGGGAFRDMGVGHAQTGTRYRHCRGQVRSLRARLRLGSEVHKGNFSTVRS